MLPNNSARNSEMSINNLTQSPSGHGSSLFQETPLNRSCENAGIPEKYCMCGVSSNLLTNSNLTTKLGIFIVNSINQDLFNSKLSPDPCIPLKYSKFLYGREVGSGDIEVEIDAGKVRYRHQDVLIAIKTKPWNAKFEARVRIKGSENNNIELLGDVGRINSYQGKSDCIQDYRMKNYCDCKNLWENEHVKKKAKKKKAKKKKTKKNRCKTELI
jgi:hypothetical protein